MSVQISKSLLSSAEAVVSIDDLLVEILLKLPWRSRLRFKFVSERWNSIITNRVLPLLHDPSPNPAIGLFYPTGSYEYEYLHLDVIEPPKKPPFREKLHFKDEPAWPYWIHQSCNGLLLCCSSCRLRNPPIGVGGNFPIRSCYVFNPTTKNFVELPRPGACDGVPRIVFSVNLVFDPCKSPLYKAVCVKGSQVGVHLLQVEIYSVESNVWRSSGGPLSYNSEIFSCGVYWNGWIHWINYQAREILYFNVDEERFQKMPVPDNVMSNLNGNEVGYFGESCGHLHIIEKRNYMHKYLNVYEMKKDYSERFVKYRLDTSLFFAQTRTVGSVLCLTRGHECSFLFFIGSGSVYRYDLVSKSIVEIFRFEHEEYESILSGFNVFEYVESLAQV